MLTVAQILSGAGLAAGVVVGGLIAEDMLGGKGSAGVPSALFTLGSAVASLLVGRLSQHRGRRPGLATGYAAGAAGAAGVVAATALDSVALLLASLLVYGAGTATNLQARYAGADLVTEERRGRAVSAVLVATTVGAVIGPNLVSVTGDVARSVHVTPLAGPFMLAGAAYLAAALVIFARMRPDPLLSSRRWAADAAREAPHGAPAPSAGSPRQVRIAAAGMVITQIVMVGIMTMTPIHMRDHGHSLAAAGMVVSIHIAAMYLPSPLTGRLVDRVGRRPVIGAGAVVLLSSGLLAALAPADSMVLLSIALGLLGLGWNLGLIGGTAMLTDATPIATRARTQGSVDLSVSLAGATGGIGSGLVVAASGYSALSFTGGAIALLLIPLLAVNRGPGVPAEPAPAEPEPAPVVP
ncbi:MFS transporter [Baekduia soli]|uniref:MFS transporter n=1 Tax=Baekduia soli TaxID=496014 RepID=A0A5B8UC58_9ACTN|nr:MFS transporter [Baekduia soli]